MNKLDRLYIEILRNGLVSIRNALRDNDVKWASAQAEYLHDIPSLIGESNINRHKYFWEGTRILFIEWANENCNHDHDYKEEMHYLYKQIWQEMEGIIVHL